MQGMLWAGKFLGASVLVVLRRRSKGRTELRLTIVDLRRKALLTSTINNRQSSIKPVGRMDTLNKANLHILPSHVIL
jgi:hypothetical protein